MSKFVNENDTQEVDVGDGEFIVIPKSLTYNQVKEFQNGDEISTISKIIKSWNLKDDDGNEVEINEKNVGKLNIQTIQKVSEKLLEMIQGTQEDIKKK